MPTPIYLSLGSNLGDRMAHLTRALESLQREGIVLKERSSVYDTEPVNAAGQADFLNLVCSAETTLDPFQLLDACQQIEWSINGVREKKGGPRKIDIDILFYDDRVIRTERLTIPHPSWRSRNFVLTPLAEIASDWEDPVTQSSVKEIHEGSTDPSRVTRVPVAHQQASEDF